MRTLSKSLLLALLVIALNPLAVSAEEVNIYSARKEQLIKPLLDEFSARTGIVVNLVTGKAGALLKRLQSEGRNTPADIFLTVDAGRLYAAKRADLLQPLESESLRAQIPSHYRDAEGYWFGLSARARVVMYSKDRVEPEQLSTYEDLAAPHWQGRICIRSSGNIYNQSLLASMIANDGVERAQSWAEGVVANMARSPQGNDRAQIKAVAAGECDIAIANTYYMGKMAASTQDDGQREAATAVGVFFPNQSDRGTHMNVSGAGVTKYAKNREQAVALLEFLASDAAQAWYAQANYEYPVAPDVAVSDIVAAWGFPFASDTVNVAVLGENNAEAVRIFDRVGWK